MVLVKLIETKLVLTKSCPDELECENSPSTLTCMTMHSNAFQIQLFPCLFPLFLSRSQTNYRLVFQFSLE